ncbi:gliding motility-associated C-terminal domain-containing protein [Cytophaga hutchinsonii]|nr:gliding motility-associated C-terminal domain-containing protein [Cytophaga hutchinsonii]
MKKHRGGISRYLLGIVFILLSFYSFAQCGTETFTVKDWCENSYAEWTITNPDPTAKYHWYEPVYNAAGTVIVDTLDRNYGENTAGTYFVSPYRYTTPSPTPVTPGWDNRTFWYVKEKPATFSLNNPTAENHAVAPATGYSMNFTSTLETRINYVTIPFFSYYVDPGRTWYVQVQIGTKYSAIYYFNSTNLTRVTTNVYLLRVPVFIDTPAGSYTMSVVTNPASPTPGTVAIGTNQLDLAMLNTATTFPINNTAGINITGSSNAGRSMIYKWETDTYCPYRFTPAAKKTTTGCCVPVLVTGVVVASNPIIVSGTDNTDLDVTVYESTSNYFQWYKDGVATTGGAGLIHINVNQAGVYSVREVKVAADLNKVSCYQEATVTVSERSLFARVNNPKASYCVGDKVTVEAYGSNIGSVAWTPASLATSPNSKITEVTLNATGTLNFTATAQVFTGPSIINGDFEAGNTGFTSDMTNTTGTPSSGQYRIDTYVTEQQSYWSASATPSPAAQMKGSGRFLYSDGFQTYQPGSIIWKQTVPGLSQNQNYTFSMDHANISWNSDPSNTARVADIDTKFDIYINNVKITTFTTDGQGQYAGVGRWKTDQVVWNSGTATQAVIEIRQQVKGGTGYDFAIDNILFGGPVLQTATVSVGPIADCFDVIPSQSACVGANKTLTAKAINTVTGEEVGVIDRWEAPVGTVVGTGKTITVSPAVTTTYTVYARFPASNLIQNSDFELGANGFKYGTANGLYNQGNSQGNFQVLKNPTTTGCGGYCVNLGDHTTGTGNMLFVDPQTADGNVIAYDFNAIGGQSYLFSLWVANAVNFASNANPLLSSVSFIVNGPGVTNQTIASINTTKDNVWNQLSTVWTPPSNGAYTLTIRAKGDATLQALQPGNSGGNDFVIDDIILAEPTSKVYSKTIVVTPCVTCTQPTSVTITTPAAATVTICQGTAQTLSGTVTVPAASSATGGYRYLWIKMGATPAANTVLTSGAITPAINTATAVPDYTGITGALTDAGKYILRVEDGTAGNPTCFRDDTLTLVINPTTVAGSIAAAQTICTGGDPVAFTSVAATGGNGTTYSYVWEKSINGAAYADITPAVTTATFDEGVLTNAGTTAMTVDYRRKVTSGACPQVTTAAVRITVNPAIVAGIVAADQTICSGGDPAAFTVTATPTGGTGTYTYQWQSASALAGTYTNIASATGATYDVPSGLTATTYYRRVDASGTCTTVNTNVITVTVQPALVPGTVTADQTICYNTAPAAFTSTAAASGGNGTSYAYQWQTSTTAAGVYTDIAGATNAAFTDATLLTADKYYRRKVTSGTVATCNIAYTAAIHITVSPDLVVGSIGTAQTICTGTAPATLTSISLPTGGKTPYTYQWQSSPDNGTTPWSNIGSATSVDYTPGTLSTDMYYRRSDISAGGCGTLYTASIKITVDPLVTAAVISSDQSICSGAAPSQIGGAAAAGGSTTATAGYVWEVSTTSGSADFSAISGATLKDYTPGTLTVDTWYRRVDKKGTCAGVASNAVKISIVAVAPATVSLSRLPSGPICEGTNVTFTASVGNGGTPAYVWTSSVTGALASTTDTYSSTTLVDGEVITVDITSSLSCANPKTATASSTMVVNTKVTPTISITADKTTICPSESVTFSITAQTNQGTAPAGPTYQWQTNKSGTYQNISGATNSTYIASSVTNGESFRVVMTTGLTCVTSATAVSTPVAVTVTPVPTLSVSIAADKATICSGNAVQFTATATGSGSTPAPTYEWFIGAAGSETSQGAGSTTANPYSTTSLTTTAALSPQTYSIYVRATSNATCASTTPAQSAAVTVTVNAGVGAGTITTTLLTICNNTVPGAITEASAASGGTSPTYTWEESIDNGAWGPATGTVSGTGFTPSGAKTGTKVSYRRIVTYTSIPAPCNTAMSNIIDITVNPALVAGVIQDDQIICSGLVPAALTQVSAPTGGTGSYTYQWQSSTTGTAGSFSNIGGATTSGYAPGALTATTYYQRVETSGTCGSVTGNMVTITVSTPEVVTAQINDPGQVCEGSVPMVFTATTTGSGTLTYAWTLDGAPVGTNSSTYSYNPTTASDAGKKVKVVVTTSIGCNAGPGISNEVALNIVVSSMPSVSITGAPAVQCSGLPVRFTVSNTTAGGNNPTYQWFIESQAGVATAVSGATNTSFTSTGLTAGDKVYVELTSNLGCALGTNPHASNKIAPAILATPAPVINETPLPICSPEGFEFTAVVGSATPPNTLQWYKDGVAISGATTSIYKAFESGLYSIEESNAACGTISTEVPLTVIQTPVANAGSDITVKEGEQVTLNGSGGVIYSWSPDTGLDDASSATPKLTADKTIMYILTVRDATGQCHDDDEVMVFVERPIKVPNVITVNGDGVNDTWEIENIESFPNAEFLIYNRWGNLVWKSTGYPKEWDATNFRNGEVLPDGTYFYIIDLHSTIYTEAYTGYIQVVK